MPRPQPDWFVGVDLAWGTRNRTGLAAVDVNGRLVEVTALTTDEEIVGWLARYASGPCLVAIDAPIIVTNPGGRRPCEAQLSQVFGRFDAGTHPSNTAKAEFADGSRAMRLADALGLDVDPDSVTDRRAIEVYPHPATIALFDLPRTVKYKHKPGRDLDFLRAETLRLMTMIETLETAAVPMTMRSNPTWCRIRATVESSLRKSVLRRVEDMIDAVLCAYVARYADRRPGLTHTFGDAETGYIVTPVTEALLERVSPHLLGGSEIVRA
jgi:predicted RNase H-like nuclease